MASDLESALKNVAQKITEYVKDAATLTVETRYVQIGDGETVDFGKAHPVAQTVLKLDGDSFAAVPVRLTEASRLEVDSALFDLHQKNVEAAIAYRERILNALAGVLRRA
jgi:hypothetical protein